MEKSQIRHSALIPIVGAVFGMGALGIDTVLPALPQIAAQLSPLNANHAQLVITMFVLGMGLGTLLGGPLSDWQGRRAVMLSGCLLYALGAALSYFAPALVIIAAARVLQGIGSSLTLVAATASVRDRCDGAEMARIMSFATMVFAFVPAIGPLLGQAILTVAPWRVIFLIYVAFAAVLGLAINALLGETLDHANRRPPHAAALAATAAEIVRHPRVRYALAAIVLNMSILFSTLASIQPIFDKSFGRALSFPIWFALIALAVFLSSFVNGVFVKRIGMTAMLRLSFATVAAYSLFVAAASSSGLLPMKMAFPVFLSWVLSLFLLQGLGSGNLNAIAFEPFGHVAGAAASIINACGLLIGSLIAIPVGHAFDGTPLPLMICVTAFVVVATAAISKLSVKV